MKLTRSKLKQIIKEALEEEFDPEAPRGEPWWVTEMRRVMTSADSLYKAMPDEGKQFLTENFEMYVKEWKKERDEGALQKDIRYRSGGEWPPGPSMPEEEKEI